MPTAITNDWSYRTQTYMEKHEHLPAECALAALWKDRMNNINGVCDHERLRGWIMSGTRVTPGQFPGEQAVNERLDRVSRLTERMFRVNLSRADPPKFKCFASDDPYYIGSEYSMKALLKLENTPDAARYNARLLDRWNNGTAEDRSALVREYLEEVDTIDLGRWEKKGVDYIMDHFEEYCRDVDIMMSAPTLYRAALSENLISEDPRAVRFNRYSDYAAGFDTWMDMKIMVMFTPAGLRFDSSLSESPLSSEELRKVNPDYAKAVAEADEETYALLNAVKIGDEARRNYEAFVSACGERGLSLPATTEEFGARYEQDFKPLGTDACNAFFDAMIAKAKNKPLPWETENYKRGSELAANDPDARRRADAFLAVAQYEEFRHRHEMYKTQDRSYSVMLNESIRNGIGLRLGYGNGEDFALIAGGESDHRILCSADDAPRMGKIKKTDVSFALDRATGKVMAVRIDVDRKYPGLTDCREYEIREATEEEVGALRAAQYESLKRELNELFDDEKTALRAMGKAGETLAGALRGVRELCASIDGGRTDLASAADQMNAACVGLGREAKHVRDTLMAQARSRSLTEDEGNALYLCGQLADFGVRRCIGVPDGAVEAYRRDLAGELKQPSALTAQQMIEKLTDMSRILRTTCTGFRRDSDEFGFLRSCVDHSLKNLQEAAQQHIELTEDQVREEFRGVFTAASDYLGHRSGMTTENARTVTRVEAAETLKALGDSLGCRPYTPTEQLADSLSNLRADQCRALMQKKPDDAAARKEMTGILKDRAGHVSRFRNNIGFHNAVVGRSRSQLLAYARTPQGLDRFLSDYQTAQKDAAQRAAQKAPDVKGPAIGK